MMFGFVSQLNIHYHASMAVVDHCQDPRKNTRATAGRRAPDAPVTNRGSLSSTASRLSFSTCLFYLDSPCRQMLVLHLKQIGEKAKTLTQPRILFGWMEIKKVRLQWNVTQLKMCSFRLSDPMDISAISLIV